MGTPRLWGECLPLTNQAEHDIQPLETEVVQRLGDESTHRFQTAHVIPPSSTTNFRPSTGTSSSRAVVIKV